MATEDHDPERASVAVGGRPGKRKRGVLPLVIGALALLLLALVIGLVSCGDDGGVDTDGAVATRDDLSNNPPATPREIDQGSEQGADAAGAGAGAGTGGAAAGESVTEDGSGASGATGASGADAAGAGGGTLSAGDASLLGQDAGAIRERVGEGAEGSALRVLSVNESGFFVGSSREDQQFVEYAGDVGEDESDQQLPRVGDVVSLEGPVRRAPADPARTLKLDEADAQLVEERGAYINAESVEQAAG